jgi:hypothetical protein
MDPAKVLVALEELGLWHLMWDRDALSGSDLRDQDDASNLSDGAFDGDPKEVPKYLDL